MTDFFLAVEMRKNKRCSGSRKTALKIIRRSFKSHYYYVNGANILEQNITDLIQQLLCRVYSGRNL